MYTDSFTGIQPASKIGSVWWATFGMVCAAIAATMIFLRQSDHDLYKSLIETGGAIESMPFAVLSVTAFISIVIAFRTKRFLPWVCFAVFCFFLAGEEAAWGGERVFGWLPFPALAEAGKQDLHNTFAYWLADNAPQAQIDSYFYEGSIFRVALYAAIFSVAGFFLIASILLGTFGLDKFTKRPTLLRLRIAEPSLQFMIAGCGLMFFANADLPEHLGVARFTGIWPMEEAIEAMASFAFALAAVVKLFPAARGG